MNVGGFLGVLLLVIGLLILLFAGGCAFTLALLGPGPGGALGFLSAVAGFGLAFCYIGVKIMNAAAVATKIASPPEKKDDPK